MAEQLLETLIVEWSVNINTKQDKKEKCSFDVYFKQHFEKFKEQCSLEEFVIFFLNYLRGQTEEYTKNTSSACNTPQKSSSSSDLQQKERPAATNGISIEHTRGFGEERSQSQEKCGGSFNNSSSGGVYRNVSRDLFSNHVDVQAMVSNSGTTSASMDNKNFTNKERNNYDEHELVKADDTKFNDSPYAKQIGNNSHHNFSNRSAEIRCSTPVRSFGSSASVKSFFESPSDYSSLQRRGGGGGSANNSQNSRNTSCLGDFLFQNNNSNTKPKRLNGKCSTTTTPIIATSVTDNDDSQLQNSKRRRRVVPTAVSATGLSVHNKFSTSSFTEHNNLLNVMPEEQERRGNEVFNERVDLMRDKNAIKKNFVNDNNDKSNIIVAVKQNDSNSKKKCKIDLRKATKVKYLDALIQIHALMIDLNLTTNILAEISYLLNLVNIESSSICDTPKTKNQKNRNTIGPKSEHSPVNVQMNQASLLKTIPNCIYFALGVLEQEKHLLALLDTTSMRVLIENERLPQFHPNLHEYLKTILTHKMNIISDHLSESRLENKHGNSVFYQEEYDTKHNYPSEREFRLFKTQRDLFYSMLRLWEDTHLNSKSESLMKLDRKVYELVTTLDHPINMAHLAKLFVAQLIVSTNFDDAIPELLPGIDPKKLSKLQQRLVAPSNFSTEYMFPGIQTFFRDFIVAAQFSMNFLEQIKIALIYELTTLDQESAADDDFENSLKPENISTLRVLAKFIGFITALPYKYDNCLNMAVDDNQITLRNLMLPSFDLRSTLTKSIVEYRILVTIPWTVQYLLMLDNVTLQLKYYKDIFMVLFELYITIDTWAPKYRQTSKFIVRICLGSLFEQPIISNAYYAYRQNRKSLNLDTKNGIKLLTLSSSSFNGNDSGGSHLNEEIKRSKRRNSVDTNDFNANLEEILNAACPFLADFRVSIMPVNPSKTVSRSGNFRYITTKLAETIEHKKIEMGGKTDLQLNLISEFIQSQSQSTRKTIDFIMERATSAAIKDFQMEFFIPIKESIVKQTSAIVSKNIQQVSDILLALYKSGINSLQLAWKDTVPKMITKRVTEAFTALLPKETVAAVKDIYIQYAIHKCLQKTSEWKTTYCSGMEIFAQGGVKAEAEKIVRNMNANKTDDYVLKLTIGSAMPSVAFARVQELIQVIISPNQSIVEADICNCICDLHKCISDQELSKISYKVAVNQIIEMTIFLIAYRSEHLLTESVNSFQTEYYRTLTALFRHPKLNDYFQIPKPKSMEELQAYDEITLMEENINSRYILNNLFNARLIELIHNTPNDDFTRSNNWLALRHFILALLQHNLIDLQTLHCQCVLLLKHRFNDNVLQKIHELISCLSSSGNIETSSKDDEYSQFIRLKISDNKPLSSSSLSSEEELYEHPYCNF